MPENLTPRERVKLALQAWSEDTINATDDALVGYMAGAIKDAVAEEKQRADEAEEQARCLGETAGNAARRMKQAESERDAAQAQAAELRRALEEWLALADHLKLSTASHRNRTRAALALTPGEALERHDERVRREARIEALEALPCEYGVRDDGVYPDCIDADYGEGDMCPRCRALAELKGGAK